LELEMLHGVGDIDLAAIDARVGERLVQESSGRPDERVARQILFVAGLLTHHHDPRAHRTLAQHRLRGIAVKVAALALLRGLPQLRNSGVRRHKWLGCNRFGSGHRTGSSRLIASTPKTTHGGIDALDTVVLVIPKTIANASDSGTPAS